MVSKVRFHKGARDGKINKNAIQNLTKDEIKNLGFTVAMDSGLVDGGELQVNESHFLRTMLSGTIEQAYEIKKLDELVGKTIAGDWSDKTIGIRTAELVGRAQVYGDLTNVPLSSYMASIEERGVVRFEAGFQVTKLEAERQAKLGYNAEDYKRRGVIESLKLSSEDVGFYGYNSTTSRIFGFLNDPNLPAYNAAAKKWITSGAVTATFEEMQLDINKMVGGLDAQSGGRFSDERLLTLALPQGYRIVMGVTSTTYNSGTLGEWLKATYPNLRIVYVPQLLNAIAAGVNGAYLYFDSVTDTDSTFSNATFLQIIPSEYTLLGRRQELKGFVEAATNATAGVICAYPWAVYRTSGI